MKEKKKKDSVYVLGFLELALARGKATDHRSRQKLTRHIDQGEGLRASRRNFRRICLYWPPEFCLELETS